MLEAKNLSTWQKFTYYWLSCNIRKGDSGSSGTQSITPSSVQEARKILSSVLKVISFTLLDFILLIVMIDTPALSANSCCEKLQLNRIILILLQISVIILSSENWYIVYLSYSLEWLIFFLESFFFNSFSHDYEWAK